MIQYPNRIYFSRWEEATEESRWLYTSAYTLASAAKQYFMKTYAEKPEIIEWWQKWNVIELHGYDAPRIAFVEYEYFGIHPFPKEIRRFVFYPQNKEIVELKILDPYILHHSHKLVPEKGIKNDPLRNPKDRQRWFNKCTLLYDEFKQHHLIDHPQAHYVSGWKELLTLKGIEIINLPDEHNLNSIDNWKVQPIEIHAECSFGDL